MKHIFTYKDLFESTSAGSQDRGSADLSPFKFAINYDPRLGYTKKDFCSDLVEIYKGLSKRERDELMDVIFKSGGIFRISKIEDLSQETVDRIIKDVETHLDSKSAYKMQVLPDGYILCYEGLKHKGRLCDVYYSPSELNIKISYTDTYPEMEDIKIPVEEFNSSSLNIDSEDFLAIRNKCDNFIGVNQVIASKDTPDSYSL